jgi:hypothetical protein
VTNFHSTAECLTCSLNNQTIQVNYEEPAQRQTSILASELCLYNAASFSPSAEFYVLECLGDRLPITYVKSTESKHAECNFLIFSTHFTTHHNKETFNLWISIIIKDVLERNNELRELIERRVLPKKGYLRVYLDNSSNLCKYLTI